jgi:hypothetical protein
LANFKIFFLRALLATLLVALGIIFKFFDWQWNRFKGFS